MENKTITTSSGAILHPVDIPTLKQDHSIQTIQPTVPKINTFIPDPEDSPVYKQLKQLTTKTSSQTGFAKQVYGEIKEEYLDQKKSANKLSLKDWKLALVAICSSLLTLLIEHWKDVADLILSLI